MKIVLVNNQSKLIALGVFLSVIYLIGVLSSSTTNTPIYVDWAREIANGNLFQLYHVYNGQSLSSQMQNLIVPYPPFTLVPFWIL